jgi:GAF domain-containing protein
MFLNPERKLFFEPTVNTIRRVLNLPASIWLLDDTGKVLRMEATTEVLDKLLHNAYLHLDEPCVTAEVFRTRRTYIVEDIKSEERWQYKAEILKMNLRSAVVVPLLIKKKTIGILYLYIPENVDFNYEGKHVIIDSFAEQIASTYRQIRSLETLNETSRLISTELQHPDRIFKHLMLSAQKVWDCNQVSIFLIDKKRDDLVLKASSSSNIKKKDLELGKQVAKQVAKQGESLLIPNTHTHPEFLRIPDSADVGVRSMLLAPIKLEDEIIGVIWSDMNGQNGFDKHDQSLMEALASQTAAAIHNINLFQQVRDQTQALTKLNELAHRLISIEEYRDSRKLLQKIANIALMVLKADLIELYEYQQGKNKFVVPQVSAGKKLVNLELKIVRDDRAIFHMITLSDPYYVDKAQEESVFAEPYKGEQINLPKDRFVIRERIQSSATIPLRSGDERVGLMFANYRTQQPFNKEQQELIELFARSGHRS